MKTELLGSLCAIWLCAGCEDPLDCGTGAHREGNECIASLNPTCAPGTELKNGSCVAVAGGGGQECGPGTHVVENKCVPDLAAQGNAMRVDDMSVTVPTDIADVATNAVQKGLMDGSILLFMGVHAPRPSALRFYGGMGKLSASEDGSYALLEEGHKFPGDSVSDLEEGPFDAKATLDGATYTTEPFVLTAQIVGSRPLKLIDAVIRKAKLETREAGVVVVTSGEITAVLTPANGDRVFLSETSSSITKALVDVLHVEPDVDQDQDGKKESWRFTMKFTAGTIAWLFTPDSN